MPITANGGSILHAESHSFYVKDYKGYTGRNPKTGEKVAVDSKRLPFFKAGKELKERVDR
jgi:integration host factor subunit beta